MKKAFREGIPSLSHRSKEFESIFATSIEGLRELLGIPGDFSVVFTSSATEIWERSIENLVEESSLHFVNGAFSKRYYDIAVQLGRRPIKREVPDGGGFGEIGPATSPELVALTHNETSTGAALPLDFIHSFRRQFPDSIIVVDAVSSLPYPRFDFSRIDSLFFSVQKGFGLPAGLGVWIINNRCIAKSEQIISKGKSIGSYRSLPSLVNHSKKNQTPETPNVLGIYLFSRVVADFNRRGIAAIRGETDYKSAALYHALQAREFIKPFVTDPAFRSPTVIVADGGAHHERIVNSLRRKGLFPGEGYGRYKNSHVRFANFPAHSKEQYDLLVDSLNAM